MQEKYKQQNLLRKLLLFVSLFIVSSICAQDYKISGQVIDLEDFSPLQKVSVQLLKTDSSLIKTVATNENGEYLMYVERKKADYIIKVSCLGFVGQTKNVHVSGKSTVVPTMRLQQDAQLLQNVEVTGNLPKVQAVEDTLIYNADAYRLPEGSVLEELIERLPGAEVEDGKITINGREVKKILLDGKEFFVGDMETALKNLPTAIIDKLKHYNEKSDMAKVTGIDDGEERPVIDVRVKKGMNRGYNVDADLAYGTADRYSGRLNANEFQQNMKVSFVANANNANGRSTPRRQGRGGGGGKGLRAQKSVAANINYDDKKTMQLDGSVTWNHGDTESLSNSSSESFVSRSGAFSNSMSQSVGRSNSWSTQFRMEWKPTKDWNIQLRPSAGINNNDRLNGSANASFNADPFLYVTDPLDPLADFGVNDTIKVNSRINDGISYGRTRNLGASLQVNRKFGEDGRNLTLRVEGNYSDSENNSLSNNYVHLFKVKDKMGNDSTYYTNRYNLTPGRTRGYSAQVTYSEPIFKATFLQFSYRFQYRNNFSDRNTYDFSKLGAQFAEGAEPVYRGWDDYLRNVPGNMDYYLSKPLSRYSEYVNYIHDLNLSLRLVRESYNFSVGVRYLPQSSHYKQDYRGVFVDTIRHTSKITPTMQFRYRFSRQNTLNVEYHGNSQEPNITQLLDITDDSNPLNISKGNPALKPSFTNDFKVRYDNYIVDRRQSIAANLTFSTTSNSISSKVTYDDETGGRTTQPENINGNWNMGGNFLFTSALDKESNWNVSTSTDVRYNHYVNYVTLNRTSDSEKNVTKTLNGTEQLSGSYRNKWLEVELNGRVNYTRGRNVLQSNANRDTWQYSYGASFNFILPWGMTIDTSINQSSRRGYNDASFNTNELIWNGQITQELLPRKKLVLTLQFYDILHQQSNFSRQLSANRRSDTWNMGVNSYAMLHVVYRIRNFGGRAGRGAGGGGRGGFGQGGGQRGGNGGGRGGFGQGRR